MAVNARVFILPGRYRYHDLADCNRSALALGSRRFGRSPDIGPDLPHNVVEYIVLATTSRLRSQSDATYGFIDR